MKEVMYKGKKRVVIGSNPQRNGVYIMGENSMPKFIRNSETGMDRALKESKKAWNHHRMRKKRWDNIKLSDMR